MAFGYRRKGHRPAEASIPATSFYVNLYTPGTGSGGTGTLSL